MSKDDRRSVLALVQLRAAYEQAALRLALYRRRTYLGRGDPQRLAELERVAHGAAQRMRRARAQDDQHRPEAKAPGRRRAAD
jgi:hypothetical protein